MTQGEREGRERQVRDEMAGRQVYRRGNFHLSSPNLSCCIIHHRRGEENPLQENPSQLINNFPHV